MSDHDELTAARESFPCPVCTANAGEDCRERDGSPVDGLHPERTDRYRRELAAWRETQAQQQASVDEPTSPALGTVTAHADVTVTKPDGTERKRGDRG